MLLLLHPALMAVLLAAHYYRAGLPVLVLLSLALIVLLLVRRPWAARTVQIALWLGSLEWLRTLFVLANARAGLGLPFIRPVVILALVTLGTALAALMLSHTRVRRYFHPGGLAGREPATAARK